MSSSSRFSTVRWCWRSWSTSACIACSSFGELTSPEYMRSPRLRWPCAASERASSSSCCSSRATRSRSARVVASARVELPRRRPRHVQRVALGQRLVTVRAVVRARCRAPGARGATRARSSLSALSVAVVPVRTDRGRRGRRRRGRWRARRRAPWVAAARSAAAAADRGAPGHAVVKPPSWFTSCRRDARTPGPRVGHRRPGLVLRAPRS